jgi:hypothetical protein
MPSVLHALFVAWQNPTTRRFHPVGRLAQIEGDGCEDCYEFVYIQGAEQARGFQPFASFPELTHLYRSRELFPMFDNRLVSPKRADFPEYIEQLGLPPATTSPLVILSRSSGRRVTDTLELFPLPEFESDYGYRTWFWAHGLRHVSPEGRQRMLQLRPDEPLHPQCDWENPVEPWAIELLTGEGLRVGFMPSYLLDDAHTLQHTCRFCEVFVDKLNPPPAPIQQRLLLRLESCWPDRFVPYSTARYQPLSEDAATIVPPVFDQLD